MREAERVRQAWGSTNGRKALHLPGKRSPDILERADEVVRPNDEGGIVRYLLDQRKIPQGATR
jgi:hypothetical protein